MIRYVSALVVLVLVGLVQAQERPPFKSPDGQAWVIHPTTGKYVLVSTKAPHEGYRLTSNARDGHVFKKIEKKVFDPNKPRPGSLASAGKVGPVEVFTQDWVTNGITLSDWSFDEKKKVITCVAIWTGGTTRNIRWDFFDKDDIRVSGEFLDYDLLVKGQKSRLTFPVKNESVKLRIVRQLDD